MKKNNMFNTPDSVDQIPAMINNVLKFIEEPKGNVGTAVAIVSIMMINNFIADNLGDNT